MVVGVVDDEKPWPGGLRAQIPVQFSTFMELLENSTLLILDNEEAGPSSPPVRYCGHHEIRSCSSAALRSELSMRWGYSFPELLPYHSLLSLCDALNTSMLRPPWIPCIFFIALLFGLFRLVRFAIAPIFCTGRIFSGLVVGKPSPKWNCTGLEFHWFCVVTDR